MSPSSGMFTFRADLLLLQRREAGLSCEQLAVLAGITPETVRRAEKGPGRPSARVVRALAEALGSTVDELAPPGPRMTLRQMRQRAGSTQQEVAERVGVSTQMVGRVENGVYGVKDPDQWAAAYGVSRTRWLKAWSFGREDRRQRIRTQPTASDGGTG